MRITDLTKEQIKKMSEEEIFLHAEKLDKTGRAEEIRKHMLDALDVASAGRIHVDSKVVD
ncbi:MAG: hypothetical protein GY938_30845 [Ketobacter sp.]|nr:hypothetical protein [Ketobacter sp.]